MSFDISIYSRYVDDAYYNTPSGTVYVYGAGGTGGTGTFIPGNYYTKVELQAGALNDLYVEELTGAANLFPYTIGDGNLMADSSFYFSDSSIYLQKNALFVGDDSGDTKYIYGHGDYYGYGNLEVKGENLYLDAFNGIYVGNIITFNDFTYFNTAENVVLDNNAFSVDRLVSYEENFLSGFTGTGWQLMRTQRGTQGYKLEVDNLIVRGSLQAYELVLNKIRANNGSLWVSAAVEAQPDPSVNNDYLYSDQFDDYSGLYWDSTTSSYLFTCDKGNNTLTADDAIRSQHFLGNNVHQLNWWVQDSSGNKIWVENRDDRNDGLGYKGITSSTVMGLVNINSDILVEASDIPERGYDYSQSAGQQFRTNYFTLNGNGTLVMNWGVDQSGGAGTLGYRVYSGDGTALSSLGGRSVSSGPWTATTTITIYNEDFFGDTSCYILFSHAAGGDADGFYINGLMDYTVQYKDVTNFTFVRMGNSSDEDRQGAIYLTADDSNAPFLEVLDSMTSHDIQDTNRKVRVGKLDGLTFNGDDITGYGIWTDSGYFEGAVNANAGYIGDWTIQDGDIIGENAAGSKIYLDAESNTISLYNVTDGIIAELTNSDILTIDDIASTTELDYDGAYAENYTKTSFIKTNNNVYHDIYYVMNHQTTGNTYLDLSTNKRADTYNIQTNAGSQYNAKLFIDVSAIYTVPDSSDFIWYLGEYLPAVPPGSLGISTTTDEYVLSGGWNAVATTGVYDYADNLLTSKVSNAFYGYSQSDIARWPLMEYKYFYAEASTYMAIDVSTYSTFSLTDNKKVWVSVVDDIHGGYKWEFVYTYPVVSNINVTYEYSVDQLILDGRMQRTQLGGNGFITYWDDDKYFSVNPTQTYTIESAGAWDHWLGPADTMYITEQGTTHGSSSALVSLKGTDIYGLYVKNENTGNSTYGIYATSDGDGNWIQCTSISRTNPALTVMATGTTSSGGIAGTNIKFGDNSEFTADNGSISHDGAGVTYWGRRLKLDMPSQVGTGGTTVATALEPITIYSPYASSNAYFQFFDVGTSNYGGIVYNGNDFVFWDTSDERLKKNIKDFEFDALDMINKVKLREWDWKKDGRKGKGFVAQELKEVFPDAVVGGEEDPDGILGVSQMSFIKPLIKAVQQLSSIVKEQENLINGLSSRLEQVEYDLESVRKVNKIDTSINLG